MAYQTADLRELEQLCNDVLRELGACKPTLSSEITRMCKQPAIAKLSPLKRKLHKLRLLAEKDGAFLHDVLQQLNFREFKGQRSPPNFIDIAERLIPELHYRGEMTGGNYRKI
jgi:hypothetical protein